MPILKMFLIAFTSYRKEVFTEKKFWVFEILLTVFFLETLTVFRRLSFPKIYTIKSEMKFSIEKPVAIMIPAEAATP